MPTVQPGATLRSLDVLVPPGTGRLSPAFSPDRTRYTLELDSDISAVGLLPTATAPDMARISVDGVATASGKQSTVGTQVGRSEVTVQVDAGDGSGHTTTYLLEVERRDMRPVVERFLKLSFDDPATGETMGYRLFVPDHYDAARSYPLVLFLHGAGERGTDNESQLTASEGATIWATPEEQAKHPAFVLAPQSPGSPRTRGWTSIASRGQPAPFDPQKELITAYDILQKVELEYRVDPARIYVTGVSQGGFGTFAIAVAHPQEFAAIVPVCGGGDPKKLASIAKMPIWIFHAAKDPTVRVGFSRNSVAALKHAKGHPKYTEYPAGTYFYPSAHNSWTSAYATVEMRDWLFEQSK
jgi:predicted peptidase